MRRQTGAVAFHRKFAANLSLLLEDAWSALAELHLTVSILLASRIQHSGTAAAAESASLPQHDGGPSTAAAASGRLPTSAANGAASNDTAEKAKEALARAAACHGSLPLGRRRQPRGVQTAHCELWSLAAGPWGRDGIRKEVHAVMTGRAAPDVSLRALAAAGNGTARNGIGGSGGRDGCGNAAAAVNGLKHGSTVGHGEVATDFVLRKAPEAAAIARVVQELYAAKATADVAARTACKQPLPLCAPTHNNLLCLRSLSCSMPAH